MNSAQVVQRVPTKIGDFPWRETAWYFVPNLILAVYGNIVVHLSDFLNVRNSLSSDLATLTVLMILVMILGLSYGIDQEFRQIFRKVPVSTVVSTAAIWWTILAVVALRNSWSMWEYSTAALDMFIAMLPLHTLCVTCIYWILASLDEA